MRVQRARTPSHQPCRQLYLHLLHRVVDGHGDCQMHGLCRPKWSNCHSVQNQPANRLTNQSIYSQICKIYACTPQPTNQPTPPTSRLINRQTDSQPHDRYHHQQASDAASGFFLLPAPAA